MEPKYLAFIHIMKTGGLSVDDYITCRCEEGPLQCNILRNDGSKKFLNFSDCAGENIFTSHGGLVRTLEYKKRFTILRDPILRVISFYNYISTWYAPYQDYSLERVYLNWDEDLNKRSKKPCNHCKQQLTNFMVRQFSGRFDRLELTSEDLEIAKQNLEKVDYIAFFPEMPIDWIDENVFGNEKTKCKMKHKNKTKLLYRSTPHEYSCWLELSWV